MLMTRRVIIIEMVMVERSEGSKGETAETPTGSAGLMGEEKH